MYWEIGMEVLTLFDLPWIMRTLGNMIETLGSHVTLDPVLWDADFKVPMGLQRAGKDIWILIPILIDWEIEIVKSVSGFT